MSSPSLPASASTADQHYLYLGMADLVTFNVAGTWTAAGVRVGDQTFRAWPIPGGKSGVFSLFAFAWNMPADHRAHRLCDQRPRQRRNRLHGLPVPQERAAPLHHARSADQRRLSCRRLSTSSIPRAPATWSRASSRSTTKCESANNKTLSDLQFKTADHFLWSQPFARQSHSQAEATFADVRNYIYQGKKIDQQVHLGYDLAATQHVGVEASNDGRIVYAAPLGIYGNCVVVDHGYGLQTIYGHMSEIHVHEGDMVKRGQVMGLSGQTGMAGGDHIHFAMQLDGVQIDPKEWWDPHWIQDHIAKRIDLPGFNAASKRPDARESTNTQATPPHGTGTEKHDDAFLTITRRSPR